MGRITVNPTLPGRGKYLPRRPVKLWKKLLCTSFLKNIYIPAETKNEFFLTSCSTSKNDVLTYIFNNLTSKVRPRRHSVAPISPGRGKNLHRWAPPFRLAVPANIPISCRSCAIQSAGGGGLGSLALSILINHTAHRCRQIPETAALYNSRHTECGGTRQDISLPRRNKSPETPGKIELRLLCPSL
jgi:hypothetical protein